MQLKGELEKGGKDMIDMTNFKKSVKWYEEVCFHCHTDNVFRNPVPLFQ